MIKQLENSYKMVETLVKVKDHIQMGVYSNRPGYKWLKDTWSNNDILEMMLENNLRYTEETIEYLESMIHLFGKDR
jgi:predicted site-specific integrase-resolvase